MLVSKLRIASVNLLLSYSKAREMFQYTMSLGSLNGNSHKENDSENGVARIFGPLTKSLYLETFYSNLDLSYRHNGESTNRLN